MRLIPALAVFALAIGFTHIFAEDHTGHDHGADKPHAEHHDEEKPPHGGILKEVPGGHLELVHDATAGSLTLYVLDGKLVAHPISAKPLTVQAKPAGAAALVPVTLTPVTADQASDFFGATDALKGAPSVEVIVRIELNGANQRVVFSTSVKVDVREGNGHQH